MKERFNMQEVQPQAFKAMFALEAYLAGTTLNTIHKELIKIRASQINGCAYCLNMHTRDALKHGETAQRIFVLDAWREAGLFTEEEKAVLAVTEEVTLIQKGLSDDTYHKAEQMLGKEYLAQVIMAVVTINAWNRIAISTHKALD
ncbi:MAG: carboxymuconolactone decarboxylase family protein [Chitinophagaceae bacterium]|nr:carboxymuconolactone decarboxylase family protein [Chitinophagaceae bacterium]